MSETVKKYLPHSAFFILAALLLAPLGYFSIFFKLPDGVHFIRQSDSLSFVLNYFYLDAAFLSPENFNLISENGKAASEFPIFYWIAAQVSHLWNHPSTIIRIIHALCFFSGIYTLFYFLLREKVPYIAAALSACIMICSTVVLYYSNNYLPDISATGLSISAVCLTMSNNKRYIIIGIGLFTLASLIKVTYAIFPIAFFASSFLRRDIVISTKSKLLLALSCTLLISAWWYYVHQYNAVLNNDYYANRAIPLWKTSRAEVAATIDLIQNYWKNSYYPEISRWWFVIIFLSFFLFIKKINRFQLVYNLLNLLGVACFVILFFQKFHDHDYYFLICLPAIAGFTLTTLPHIFQYKNQKWFHYLATSAMAIVLVSAYVYVTPKIEKRWAGSDYIQTLHPKIEQFRQIIERTDSERKDKILVIGDSTMNGTLYQLERKGYALPIIPKSNKELLTEKLLKDVDWIILLKKPSTENPILNERFKNIYHYPALIDWKK
jgi:hypothetical protein